MRNESKHRGYSSNCELHRGISIARSVWKKSIFGTHKNR